MTEPTGDGRTTFTTKELIVRMETALNAKMDTMRQEMMAAQASMVNKNELEVHLRTINRDTDRIERQLRDELNDKHNFLEARLREYREESKRELSDFKEDINSSIQRMVIVLGLVISIIQVILAVFSG